VPVVWSLTFGECKRHEPFFEIEYCYIYIVDIDFAVGIAIEERKLFCSLQFRMFLVGPCHHYFYGILYFDPVCVETDRVCVWIQGQFS
jgi:hypothetical protein